MGFLNQLISSVVPGAAIEKASPIIAATPAMRQPKAMLADPLSLAFSMGYKDRKTSLSYDMLKKVSNQLAVIAAIINTRVNQVATFTTPFRQTRNLGFEIKHKDRDHKLTRSERDFILELEGFVSSCGKSKKNPYSVRPRDNFDQFTRKVIRDRMIYDSLTFEVVPDRRGNPFEFVAVDASTIRLSVDPKVAKKDLSKQEFANIKPYLNNGSYMEGFDYPRDPSGRNVSKKNAAYVQVWQGNVVRAFSETELAFSISNPRTDVNVNGYGYSEIEQLIDTITAQLWAEQYNRNFFKQGAAPKGILNIRGENIPPEQLEAFKRAWSANIAGVENSWRTPVLQSEEVQYLNLQNSNMEMEYSRWMEYLIKLICAVYLIAPEEIGFAFSAGGMQQPMVDTNNEWKLKASKDRGLRPLLKFYADSLNRNVINKIDNNFYLDFVGLDELTERERIELRQSQVQYFRTVNEIRKDEDLDPVEDGDFILNPAYLQFLQMKHQWDTEKEQRKEQKELQERQLKMQEQQQKQAQQAQQQQISMQRQQMAQQQQMQQQQQQAQQQAMAMQAGGDLSGSPEQMQEGQEEGQAGGQGGPEQAGPAGQAEAGGAEAEAAVQGVPQGSTQQDQKEEVTRNDIKEFINSLPPEILKELT